MTYTGRVKAVVLDWAGTAVDHGCCAPVGAFIEVFRRRNVDVSLAEAREPMGTHKREHIRRMTIHPAIRERWHQVNGHVPTATDVDDMYTEAGVIQIQDIPKYATPIAGVVQTVAALRARGIRIGSTTGYTREMLDVLVAAAAEHGYKPDSHVASTEVPEGRPAPYLAWLAVQRMGVWPAAACVKVGDTVVDVQAGRNAGFWSVGIAATGNEVGLSAQAFGELTPEARFRAVSKAHRKLKDAGAHYVIDSVADLLPVIDDIEIKLSEGETP